MDAQVGSDPLNNGPPIGRPPLHQQQRRFSCLSGPAAHAVAVPVTRPITKSPVMTDEKTLYGSGGWMDYDDQVVGHFESLIGSSGNCLLTCPPKQDRAADR